MSSMLFRFGGAGAEGKGGVAGGAEGAGGAALLTFLTGVGVTYVVSMTRGAVGTPTGM